MNTNMGIYKIINKADGKFYIGSSKELKRRKRVHFKNLKDNKHVNTHLQHAFNKYGKQNFKFEVIEYTDDPSTLLDLEQKWIDETNPLDDKIGYNIMPNAVGGSEVGIGSYRSIRTLKINPVNYSIVNSYESINEAFRIGGYDTGFLCRICNMVKDENIKKKGYGYYWCYEDDYHKIPKIKQYKNPYIKSIIQINPETLDVIKIWSNIKSAEQSVSNSHGNISRVCRLVHTKNEWRKAYRFYWCYEKDLGQLEKLALTKQ